VLLQSSVLKSSHTPITIPPNQFQISQLSSAFPLPFHRKTADKIDPDVDSIDRRSIKKQTRLQFNTKFSRILDRKLIFAAHRKSRFDKFKVV
jgi:hypothetical protein